MIYAELYDALSVCLLTAQFDSIYRPGTPDVPRDRALKMHADAPDAVRHLIIPKMPWYYHR